MDYSTVIPIISLLADKYHFDPKEATLLAFPHLSKDVINKHFDLTSDTRAIVDTIDTAEPEQPVKRGRGRPKKVVDNASVVSDDTVKRPRGRPKKVVDNASVVSDDTVKRAPGRPKKTDNDFKLPYTGVVDDTLCFGIAYNSALFTQCSNKKMKSSIYCSKCNKQAKINACGKPDLGNIDDRNSVPLDSFVDHKGRKVVDFNDFIKKHKYNIDDLISYASSLNITLPISTSTSIPVVQEHDHAITEDVIEDDTEHDEVECFPVKYNNDTYFHCLEDNIVYTNDGNPFGGFRDNQVVPTHFNHFIHNDFVEFSDYDSDTD